MSIPRKKNTSEKACMARINRLLREYDQVLHKARKNDYEVGEYYTTIASTSGIARHDVDLEELENELLNEKEGAS